jgi:hypothetical protein
MMYKDPKSFINKYLEKYKEDIKDFKLFKSEIEVKLMDSDISERERLETQYFLYYLEKNLKGKLAWQGSARGLDHLTSSPGKAIFNRQSITPEKRKNIRNVGMVNLENSKKNSVSMNQAEYQSNKLSEIKKSAVFKSQALSDFSEFSVKNLKKKNLPEEINLTYRTDNSNPQPKKNFSSSPSKQSVKSISNNKDKSFTTQSEDKNSLKTLQAENEKSPSLQNESSLPTDELNTSINSVPSQQLQKIRKINLKKPLNKDKTGSLPIIQLKKSLIQKKQQNLIDPKPSEKDQNQSLLNHKKMKFIRKKGPCNHMYHYSPITKLSILDDHHKGLIQSNSIPVIDESKKLDLIMRSVSLEKQKNFKNFQLVKLFNF